MRYGYKSRQINCFFADFNTILQYPFGVAFAFLTRYKCKSHTKKNVNSEISEKTIVFADFVPVCAFQTF